jgi:ADP-heptose:LPS heptosyltransferase
VAAPERWDEACFSVPAVRALMASGLRIGVICHEDQHALWQTLPHLEILTAPCKAKPKAIASIIRGSWQAALLWEPGVLSQAIQSAGVPRRMGPHDRNLKKWLTHPLKVSDNFRDHRVRHYLSIVEEMGIQTHHPDFFSPAGHGVKKLLGSALICPDSDFGPSHEWPLERWLEIANHLSRSDHRVTVIVMDRGRGLGQSLVKQLGDGAVFFHASPFASVIPVLAQHALFIAADGSLPHLAAHLGATCVTLFGPNDPSWKRPLGRRHAVVRQHVACSPCLLEKCPMDGRCQLGLASGRVLAAVMAHLP